MKITTAQLNPTVGDLNDNFKKIQQAFENAERKNSDLVITPELSLTGYPLEDLVLNPDFLNSVKLYLNQVKEMTKESSTAVLVGAPFEENGKIYNSAFLFEDGKVVKRVDKTHLPNEEVFDEKRYFSPNKVDYDPIDFRGVNLGILICEDTWHKDVAQNLKSNGADILLSINASPFREKISTKRNNVVAERVKETGIPCVYLNLVGGQDELVFDGGMLALNSNGTKAAYGNRFIEENNDIEFFKDEAGKVIIKEQNWNNPLNENEEIWQAMMLGLKDYITKTFGKEVPVVLGLSGGVDSAIVATLAADALGPDKVKNILMPSKYTSDMSNNDAVELCQIQGMEYTVIPIEKMVNATGETLNPVFKDTKTDVTEENIQARSRGMIIMALSNKFGWLPLSTGNKSEMAVGYCTLYGDMCGGFNPIKDLYKTEVFKLCNWRNNNIPINSKVQKTNVIPTRIITRPPSAELAPGQVDTNSLPEYEVLDGILRCLLEDNSTIKDVINSGYKEKDVERVFGLLNRAEYKRRQAPPGIKLTKKALRSSDRRFPIVNKYPFELSMRCYYGRN